MGPRLDGSGIPSEGGAPPPTVAPGEQVTIFAVGLGAPEAPPEGGTLGAGLAPALPQRAYLDGVALAISSVQLSETSVGVYELTFQLPESAQPGGVLSWYSGNSGARALLGSRRAPEPVYIEATPDMATAAHLDMSALNPHAVAVSGALDIFGDFCYSDVHLLDFRRESVTAVEQCLLPSNPLAPAESDYWPFEAAKQTPVLAALAVPEGDPGEGQTNRLLLVDTASAEGVQIVTLEQGADRLQPAFGNNPQLRLHRSGGVGVALVSPAGEPAGEDSTPAPLPDPLEAEGRSVPLAQGASLPGSGGYRMRFLGPGPDSEATGPLAVLFDPLAKVAFQAPFPEGWAPISPPRRTNNQGVEVGNALGPAVAGPGSADSIFGVVRSTDGMQDGVIAFRVTLPEPPEQPPSGDSGPTLPEAFAVEVTVTPFPDGSFAANCHPLVRWLPVGLTGTLALVGAGEPFGQFASPRDNRICAGDRLILVDTESVSVRAVEASGPLDQSAKGALNSYLYFADGGRDVALRAPTSVHVFDGGSDSFSEIALPEGTGITLTNPLHVQQFAATGRIVALATGGPVRTNPRGITAAPFPGNRGLVIVDLPAGTATNLPLPDSARNLLPGPTQLFRRGRRTFGAQPTLGRAFAIARMRGGGPGNPAQSGLILWDLGTGTGAAVPLPENGHTVGFPVGQQAAQRAARLWDFRPGSGAISYGVLDSGGQLVAIGNLGP